jgi:1-deoxy-D-xylulose-5-phosphate synthase
MTVTAPKDGTELLALLKAALQVDGPVCLRYPRDVAPDATPAIARIEATPHGTWEVVRHGAELAIFAVGTMVNIALAAADLLKADGLSVTVVNCRYLKPYDEVTLAAVLAEHKNVLVVEEGTVVNGFGAYMSSVIARHDSSIRVATHGVPDRVIHAAPRARQLATCGLDATGIANKVRSLLESEAMAG